jgi:hypothetical protein
VKDAPVGPWTRVAGSSLCVSLMLFRHKPWAERVPVPLKPSPAEALISQVVWLSAPTPATSAVSGWGSKRGRYSETVWADTHPEVPSG